MTKIRSMRDAIDVVQIDACRLGGNNHYVCVSKTRDGRITEYINHLHEHFVHLYTVKNAAHTPPTAPGFSMTMQSASLEQYRYCG